MSPQLLPTSFPDFSHEIDGETKKTNANLLGDPPSLLGRQYEFDVYGSNGSFAVKKALTPYDQQFEGSVPISDVASASSRH